MKAQNAFRWLLLASSAGVSFAAQTAWAQAADDTGAGGDIVVTAQRREEALQDVPIAITVFDSEMRDRLGIKTIQDFTNFTPGLSYDTGNERLSLRGIGRLTNQIGSDPGIAIYNDGFYTSSPAEASKTPMFVNRVEVLRGPQGTLYGRNSVGGALNVISNRPSNEFQGEVRTTFEENYGGAVIEGYVSGPLVGGLKTRLTAQFGPLHVNDGYTNIGIDDAGNSFRHQGEGYRQRRFLEAQLQYDFSDTTQLWLKWTNAKWSDHTRSGNFVGSYNTTDIFPDGALLPNAAFGYTVAAPGKADPRKINVNTWNDQKLRKNHTIVANFGTELGGMAVKYVGGYQQYLYTDYSDLDDTPRSIVRTGAGTLAAVTPLGAAFAYSFNPTYVQEYIEDKNFSSHEVTFANKDKSRFNWIFGLYHYREHYYQPITWFVGGADKDTMSQALLQPINIIAGGLADPNPRRIFYAGSGDLRLKSYAAFGQADYALSDTLTLTAGLRYSTDKKRGIDTYRLVNWDPTRPDPGCFDMGCGAFAPALDLTTYVTGVGAGKGTVSRVLTGKWSGLTGRLALDWKPNPDTLVFASYGRGLKSGGFTMGIWSAAPIVKKEDVDAFELGLKSKPMRGLTFNLTTFHYRYKNAQVPIEVLQPASGLVRPQFFNMPMAKSTGLEVETAWNPAEWLELMANYSYLDAKITDDTGLPAMRDQSLPGAPLVVLKGNRLPQSAKHKVALSGLIDIPTASGSHFMLAGSYVYRTAAYYSVLNGPWSRAPAWDQVDARLTWVDPSRRVTAMLYVRNLFDTLGYDGASAASGSGSQGFGQSYNFTPPRAFGAEVQFKF